jgi:hypothetical protein
MIASVISAAGLLLCLAPAAVHGAELVSPMLSRWVIRFILPFFGPGLPSAAAALSYDEQLAMLDAGRAAGPSDKAAAAADYVFLMLFEQRQGALAFIAVAVGALYGVTLPLDERGALHLLFAVMSVLFAAVNANHAGIPLLGHHPRVSRHGRNVGLVFTPFWVAAAGLNVAAFVGMAP